MHLGCIIPTPKFALQLQQLPENTVIRVKVVKTRSGILGYLLFSVPLPSQYQ